MKLIHSEIEQSFHFLLRREEEINKLDFVDFVRGEFGREFERIDRWKVFLRDNLLEMFLIEIFHSN